MHLAKITLTNFRNYQKAELTFSPCLNIICGLNAQGKTNLLEAIYLICLGRSFRFATNEDLLRDGCDFLLLEGELTKKNSIQKRIVLHYKREGKKEISIDRKRVKSQAAVFGQFPTIVMSPDDYRITTGGPSERRRFVDLLLSQTSSSYLSNLQEYHRILRQRNRILQNAKEGRFVSESAIEPWTQNLVSAGSKILSARERFVEKFVPMVDSVYKKYTDSSESLSISIKSSVEQSNGFPWEENLSNALRESCNKERVLGRTMVGPHRDDISFTVNDRDLRTYGSRGEHKSVLISLKLAEFSFLRENTGEIPIFLLDDYRSELDAFREKKVFASLRELGQIFLTSPTEDLVRTNQATTDGFWDVSTFRVKEGQIEQLN